MTVDGAVQKTALLLLVAAATGTCTWMQLNNAASWAATLAASRMAGGAGLVAVLAMMFRPRWSPWLALVYAAANGVAMAGLSASLELRFHGLAMNAVVLTFSTAASLLMAYQTGAIQVTDRFADGVRTMTGGFFLSMMAMLLLRLVGVHLPNIFTAGPLAIGFSLVSAVLAAANLLLDFSYIRSAAAQRAPKWMEWYGAMSLMVTLVWMYTEVLKLLWMFSGSQDD